MSEEEYEALKAEARRLRVAAKTNPHDEESWKAWTNAINELAAFALGIEHRGEKTEIETTEEEA